MVTHIVSWKLKKDLTTQEIKTKKLEMKKDLEILKQEIPGILKLDVIVDLLPCSDADILLNSLFESEEALTNYQNHPSHISVKNKFAAFLQNRTCIDYKE